MNLMIANKALRAAPRVKTADILSFAVADCTLGKVLLAQSNKGVCAILIGDSAEDLVADLARRFPQAMLVPGEAAVKEPMEAVLRFIAAPSVGLHLTLDTRGTPFQRRVWERLRTIPVGSTVSYRELAGWISPLASPRAVGAACAANPIALAIPCHRVLRANGELAGYRWGIERKRELLRKEAMA
ncbi:methylated-DNA--[protein]-cysteine S-methyltransferase [Shinella sp.]|uniref:methylated-DNA--[protein]-cysteine S-methyltransferase n=1 Tax=Shinella sp. TaxID=1870904 RepID=UPI003F6F978A